MLLLRGAKIVFADSNSQSNLDYLLLRSLVHLFSIVPVHYARLHVIWVNNGTYERKA
jgi:hypothetical protein